MHHLGHTRSSVKRDHMLLTPDSFIRSPMPGFVNALCIVHIAPQCGAAFAQYTAELGAGGRFGPCPLDVSRFVYVLEGELTFSLASHSFGTEGQTHTLTPGGYAFVPMGHAHTLESVDGARVVALEKPYVMRDDVERPEPIVGHVDAVPGTPIPANPALTVKMLLPEHPSYDFAVNTMRYPPGSSLHLVEIHQMEHGLLMLEGEGTYRLGDQFYPVQKGDVIYMAPYCPQWFGALGTGPSSYLLYKDWNRHPLE